MSDWSSDVCSADLLGIYIQDQIGSYDRVSLVLGARRDRVTSSTGKRTTPPPSVRASSGKSAPASRRSSAIRKVSCQSLALLVTATTLSRRPRPAGRGGGTGGVRPGKTR